MRALPTGTVTLLFTEIEGSTRLLQQVGESYSSVLEAYRSLLRACAGYFLRKCSALSMQKPPDCQKLWSHPEVRKRDKTSLALLAAARAHHVHAQVDCPVRHPPPLQSELPHSPRLLSV